MANLSTNYLGLTLQNPLIVGASPLTGCADSICRMADNGAAAVVLKTLYEDEVAGEKQYNCHFNLHPEAYNYDVLDADMVYGAKAYVDLIKEAKKRTQIPVIASIHCRQGKWWAHYPKMLEEAGADALELNLSYLGFDDCTTPNDVVRKSADAVRMVKSKVSIPVAVKFTPYFSAVPYLVKQLQGAGADGVVMFSRLFKLGIDIETMQYTPVSYYSSPMETYKTLRWVGLIHAQSNIDICASTGIHSSNEAIQHLLAGANAFQVVSTVYQNGEGIIRRILNKIERWMDERQILNIAEMRDMLCTTKGAMFEKHHMNPTNLADTHLQVSQEPISDTAG